jgi:hypothetical protein
VKVPDQKISNPGNKIAEIQAQTAGFFRVTSFAHEANRKRKGSVLSFDEIGEGHHSQEKKSRCN